MIYLATDHRGFKLKEKTKSWLTEWGYQYKDMGAFEYNKDDDYPDFIRKAAEAVANDPERSRGIILGGSGQGEAMAANRYKGVRAAVYYSPSTHSTNAQGGEQSRTTGSGQAGEEMIKMSREHNDSNVLSLGASFLSEEAAKSAIKLWLETPFSGEERHVRRINRIDL